ncbi:MAG TPA: serine--tRNA ligase [Acetobacteraceae bacterium]|nr:serine--tRNA ligase [Acetobacteraceae bacterium]
MHDIRAIREDPWSFNAAMVRRDSRFSNISDRLVQLDKERRELAGKLQEQQSRRNELAKEIGLRRREGADTQQMESEALSLKAHIATLEHGLEALEQELRRELEVLPNILDHDVPDGFDERDNQVERQVGTLPAFDFTPRQHFELGEALGQMDFAAAAKLAGSRFTILRGPLARLERALGQFMLDLHTRQHGYEEVAIPLLVNDATAYGTAQLPKFAEDLFRTTDGRWLVPTAEVPLTNLAAGEILPEAALPLRVTALSDCFRSEAGAAGKDTRGMLRQHQFRKVELVSITRPEDSVAEHERMTECAEAVLKLLELPYRRVLLCAGDTGFASAKTYDLEVWLPGQQAWREISSCSNCRDFQARRMNARYRPAEGKGVAHVHTLNGSGVAVGRALIAVMENHQQADGTIRVPAVLRPYLPGLEQISAA